METPVLIIAAVLFVLGMLVRKYPAQRKFLVGKF